MKLHVNQLNLIWCMISVISRSPSDLDKIWKSFFLIFYRKVDFGKFLISEGKEFHILVQLLEKNYAFFQALSVHPVQEEFLIPLNFFSFSYKSLN